MANTIVDPTKVHLTEKEIEDWLWENPKSIRFIDHWIGRQVRLPSGIADLFGISTFKTPVIVEVKNVPIDSSALTQVCRYAADIDKLPVYWEMFDYSDETHKIVVCNGEITNQLMFEAKALGVSIHSFEVELSLTISGSWSFSQEFNNDLLAEYDRLANSPDFEPMKVALQERDAEWQLRKKEFEAAKAEQDG